VTVNYLAKGKSQVRIENFDDHNWSFEVKATALCRSESGTTQHTNPFSGRKRMNVLPGKLGSLTASCDTAYAGLGAEGDILYHIRSYYTDLPH
jgi:hypothetical protein